MKSQLTQQLTKLIKKKYPAYKAEVNLEYPPDSKIGDLGLPCFELAKIAKKSPNEIAKELAQEFSSEKLIAKARAIGPYLNFFLNKDQAWKKIFKPQDPKPKTQGLKVMLEFSSPNTNKPLHLGHLRNIALGDSLSRLLESQGHKVIRASLVNDRGVHICKSMLAYQKVKSGEWQLPKPAARRWVSAVKKGDHIVGDYYVLCGQQEKKSSGLKDEVQEMLKRWEAGDKETIALWKKLNKMVLKGLDETYKRLGIRFDKLYFESQEFEAGKKIILAQLKAGKCYKRKDGAIEIDLEKYGLDKKVLLRADGTSVYITQDIGLAVNRQKSLQLDKIAYVVGNEQEYHFKALFKILELFGYQWAKNLYHLSYAMVNLATGKLKSREGTRVDADDLMDEVHEFAESEIKKREPKISKRELEKRAEIIGLGAMKFYLVKHSPNQTITYNPRESISFEGATGPYVQYTYARIKSILKKAKKQAGQRRVGLWLKSKKATPADVKYQLLSSFEEWKLGQLLSRYQEVVAESANEYKPSKLAVYLLDLSQAFNTFYHKHSVLKAKDNDLLKVRLALISKVAQVISSGLEFLGLDIAERI